MIKKILTRLFSLSMGAGFFMVLGTVGSLEKDLINFDTFFIRCGIGFLIMVIGFIGLKFTNPIYSN